MRWILLSGEGQGMRPKTLDEKTCTALAEDMV